LPAAVAQTSGADTAAESSRLETVVVTTRKRAEAQQTVPVSVSAFSTENLDRQKITGAADLQFSVPNAVLTGNDRFTIRGIGNNSLGGDNGVGLAINGASLGYPPQDELYDLDRIEVLRGPQGTLFGRNTTGGALAVFTKRPTAQFGGQLSVELGNFDHSRVGGVLNIPITESIRQRFAGYVLRRDGFTRNETTGSRIDGRDQYSLRSSTQFFLGDDTEANLVLSSYREDSSRTRESKRQCRAVPVLGCSPNELGPDLPDFNATLFRTLSGPLTQLGYLSPGSNIYAGAPSPTDLRAVAADQDPRFRLHYDFATLDVTHNFSAATLTWIGGWSRSSTEQTTDYDNAALPFRFARDVTYSYARDTSLTTRSLYTTDSFTAHSKTWTQELRLSSRGTGALSWTTGLFQLDSRGGNGFFVWHPFFELIQKVQGRPADTWYINTETRNSVTKALAWFGEGQWRFSPTLRGTLGARFTTEKRNSEGRSIILSALNPFTKRPTIDDEHWTGRTSLDWSPDRDTLVYGSVATGYKGGGFNTGSATRPTFKPETVTAFELGLKREWLNRTLRTNVSAFYNDYKDMQIAQRIAAAAITANTDAKTRGVELELAWAPSKPWLLDSNVSLLRTRIGEFSAVDAANPAQSLTSTTPDVAVNLSGNELPHAPKAKVKLGAQYSTGLFGTGWTATGRIDHVWQDAYFAREFNRPTDRIGSWSVTNLQVRFVSPKGDIEVRSFVKNVADNDNVTSIIVEDPLVGRYRNVRLLDPRTFGVQVQYNF
jgi:outer membrane receptor protein involved in Fe transport